MVKASKEDLFRAEVILREFKSEIQLPRIPMTSDYVFGKEIHNPVSGGKYTLDNWYLHFTVCPPFYSDLSGIQLSLNHTLKNDINKNTLIDTRFVVGQVVYTRGFFRGEIDEYIVKEVTYNHGKVSVYLQHEWDRDKTCYSATVYHEEDFDKLFTDRKELEALIKKESFVERVNCANASIVED